jgi:hypothetical protein
MMSLLVQRTAMVLSLLLAAAAHSQEGYPLDGTWRGEWGPDGGKSTVVIVMKWDGTNVNGMINPGPNVVRFAGPVLDPSDWTVRIEAESRDGQPIVIDAKLEDLGSYNRTLTGTWTQAGIDHSFEMARE